MKKLGFTLAEVLITLVIIGVIAAMAIPTVMNNTNAQEYKTAFKKAIETMNSGLQMEYAAEGMTAQDFSDASALVEILKFRLNVMDAGEKIEWPVATTSNEAVTCNGTVFATQDGMIFCVQNTFNNNKDGCDSYNMKPCGAGNNLAIDVNGAKGPNAETTDAKRPRDQYQASIYAQKVVPYGKEAQAVMYDMQENVHKTTTSSSSS